MKLLGALKSIHRLVLSPAQICSRVQLGLHVGSPTARAEVVPKAVACLWIPFPSLGCLVCLSGKRCT